MSTHWGYHCKTCPQLPDGEYGHDDDAKASRSDTWMNHGDDTLRSLAKLAPHFKAIQAGDTTGYVEMHVMAHGPWPILWLIEHDGHDIELHNEYGGVEPIELPEGGQQ